MAVRRVHTIGNVKRITQLSIVLCSAWLAGAAPASESTVWTVIGFDLRGDAHDPSLADAALLSYQYDKARDFLWFRIGLYTSPTAEAFRVNIAVDTGSKDRDKVYWWGANTEFTFDRLVTVWATGGRGAYHSTSGISDADGARRKQFTNLKENSVELRFDKDAILIGVKRVDLTDAMTMNVIASIGSNERWNDDVPNTRSASIDLAAPRPARGLREIDVSRNNLAFGGDQNTLADTAAPRIVQSGRGSTTLILLPGVYSGNTAFDGFISRNASRYKFYTLTPPGLDGTLPRSLPPESASAGEFVWTRKVARDVLDLIKQKGLDRPIVVTHGFPGSLAVEELARNNPGVLGGVVEIASMATLPYPSSSVGREATPAERVAMVDDSWTRQWFKYVTPETWESNNYLQEMFANDPVRAERARQEVEAVPLPVKIRYLIEYMASDNRSQFGTHGVPLLALRPGFNDAVLSNPAFTFYKTSFLDGWNAYPANSRVQPITIPNARALMLDDQPELTDHAIDVFVKAHSS
jgi:pimeloyl-ACP methyl ester carboxylesterase